MKAKYLCTISQAQRIILAIWLASFLLATPMLLVQAVLISQNIPKENIWSTMLYRLHSSCLHAAADPGAATCSHGCHLHLYVMWLEVVGVKHRAHWCARDRDNILLWRLHELYMLLLILVLPTAVMAFTYTCICWEVWSVVQARYDMTTGKATLTCENFPLSSKRSMSFKQTSKASQEENNTVKQEPNLDVIKDLTTCEQIDLESLKKVVKMLVMIVVVFVVCWAPMLIDNCLTAWQVLASERPGSVLKHMYTAFTLMAYFNSCVNPIVYGFMSKNFRQSFRQALCVWRRPTARGQLCMSHGRSSSMRLERDRTMSFLVSHSTPTGMQP